MAEDDERPVCRVKFRIKLILIVHRYMAGHDCPRGRSIFLPSSLMSVQVHVNIKGNLNVVRNSYKQ